MNRSSFWLLALALALAPGEVSAQPAAFVQAIPELVEAAARVTQDPAALRQATSRLTMALAEWDRTLATQEARTRQELREATSPRQSQLHTEMGIAYRTRGRLADALGEFDAAAAVEPSSDLQLLRGLTLEAGARTEDAGRAFRAAWSGDSANAVKAYYVVSRGSSPGADDLTRARGVLAQAYDRLRSATPPPANAPFVMLDAVLDTIVPVPVVGNAQIGRAFALLASGKYSEAVAALSMVAPATAGVVDGPLLRFRQAQEDEKENRVSEAREGYVAALAGALSGRSAIYVAIGRLSQVEGDMPAALDAFGHAVRLNPNDATTRQELANAYVAAGQTDAAFAELVAGLLVNPANGSLHAAIGRLRLDAGDASGAVPALARALELDPAGYEVRYALATALARAGKPDEAKAQLDLFEKTRREMLERRRQDIQHEVDRNR